MNVSKDNSAEFDVSLAVFSVGHITETMIGGSAMFQNDAMSRTSLAKDSAYCERIGVRDCEKRREHAGRACDYRCGQ